MPLLRAEAEKLSNNKLVAGIVEEIIDRDAMFAMLPFQALNSKALVYNRENTAPEGDFYDPNEALSEEAATFTEHTAKLRILINQVDVDKFLAETMADTNDQVAIQLQQSAKGMSRKFRRQLAQGDSATNAKAFDGLPKLVANDMTINAGANGGAVTLEMLDELRDMVKYGIDAYVMRPGTWRAIRTALRAMGGTTPVSIEMENFGYPVPAFDGIPVVINEFLAADEVQGSANNTCSIYGVRMNEVDGLHGIYGGSEAGIRLEPIGTVENKDSWRFRLKWYCGTVLKSSKSLARLKGVTNI